MSAWIGLIGVVIGIILTASVEEFRSWRERKERYQIMTFDKRLEAHQKAFYWVQEINISLNSGKPEEMHNVANAAREWWNTSCLFLDMKSQKALMLTINLAHVYASEQNGVIKDFGIGNKVWGSLLDSSVAIVAGIGVKYLPEMNSDNNNAKTKTATG